MVPTGYNGVEAEKLGLINDHPTAVPAICAPTTKKGQPQTKQ